MSKSCKPGTGDPHPTDWKCTPCSSVGKQPCKPNGCLFNISADPNERNDLSASLPQLMAELKTRYLELGASVCTPAENKCIDYIGVADQERWVNQTLATMWVSQLPNAGPALPPLPTPPSPPSPPSPAPINPGILSGKYTAGNERITLEVSGVDPQPGQYQLPLSILRFVLVGQLEDTGEVLRFPYTGSKDPISAPSRPHSAMEFILTRILC